VEEELLVFDTKTGELLDEDNAEVEESMDVDNEEEGTF